MHFYDCNFSTFKLLRFARMLDETIIFVTILTLHVLPSRKHGRERREERWRPITFEKKILPGKDKCITYFQFSTSHFLKETLSIFLTAGCGVIHVVKTIVGMSHPPVLAYRGDSADTDKELCRETVPTCCRGLPPPNFGTRGLNDDPASNSTW